MAVEVNNLTRSFIDKNLLKKVAEKVLRGENRQRDSLSIVLAGLKRMKDLNRKYRKESKPTDVLSFNFSEELLMGELGEIIICPDLVKKNAERYESTFKRELVRVLIHGILHLLGYNHKKPEEAQKMEKRQNHYLSKLSPTV